MTLIDELTGKFHREQDGIFASGLEGYWSNLNKQENELLLGALKDYPARKALLKYQPWLENVIYSAKRQAGLDLLQLTGTETCIDYGCMWGALTIPLAKRTDLVLGIDQTRDSLRFLKARMKEEEVSNIELLCLDLKKMPVLNNKADIAIVNGVLEWIPESGPIELKSYYGKFAKKEYAASPIEQQKKFLKSVFANLKSCGKLYLAIENRYSFKMFLGARDPHAGLLFTSFLPRKIADWISLKTLGRHYINWIYSFSQIESLLKEAGFNQVELYMSFPDYRFPEQIIPFTQSLQNYRPTIAIMDAGKISLKRRLIGVLDIFFFNILKAKPLAPSIIAIASKS